MWQGLGQRDKVLESGGHEFSIGHVYVKGLETFLMTSVLVWVLQRN